MKPSVFNPNLNSGLLIATAVRFAYVAPRQEIDL